MTWRGGILALGLIAGLAAGGCTRQTVAPDTAELRNMFQGNLIPRSTPREMVKAFETVCTAGPRDDAALRARGYVPLSQQTPGARAYVIDNRQPAIAVSNDMCMVLASARTGQTTAFRDHVSDTYPGARAIDPAPLGARIEDAWSLPIDPPALIATERTVDVGVYRYALILYQPGDV